MNLRTLAVVAALVAAGCGSSGSSARAPAGPTPPAAPEDEALLPWLTGDHALAAPAGGQLSFVASRGARYGVWLGDDGGARVWIFDETSATDATPRAWSVRLVPGAAPTSIELRAAEIGATAALFTSDDAGTATLTLRRGPDGALAGAEPPGLAWERSAPVAAAAAGEIAALEALFAKDSAERGADAWVQWFAADGAELSGGALVSGHDAIRAEMTQLFAGAQLVWTPKVTRARGDVAFAVGTFEVLSLAGEQVGAGSYVTVWKKDPTSGWKVWFDGGRPQ
ncbi:MAG: hypothetical protein IPL61_26610 [Myxococcales bacterium]|nr:hypothetical protein [Myxococcales bacterium]